MYTALYGDGHYFHNPYDPPTVFVITRFVFDQQ